MEQVITAIHLPASLLGAEVSTETDSQIIH